MRINTQINLRQRIIPLPKGLKEGIRGGPTHSIININLCHLRQRTQKNPLICGKHHKIFQLIHQMQRSSERVVKSAITNSLTYTDNTLLKSAGSAPGKKRRLQRANRDRWFPGKINRGNLLILPAEEPG